MSSGSFSAGSTGLGRWIAQRANGESDAGSEIEAGEGALGAGHNPIRLDRPGAWWIEAGSIELFASRQLGAGSGARRHLATLSAGDMLFGCADGVDPSELLAVPSRDTRWWYVTAAGLKRLARDESTANELGIVLERWIENLVRSVAPRVPPRHYHELRAGSAVTLDEENRWGLPSEGLVWVRHVHGKTRFLGLDRCTLEPSSSLTPVPEGGWLEGVERSRELEGAAAEAEAPRPVAELSCVGTLSLLQSGGAWESLKSFHRLFLELLQRDRARRHAADRRRLATLARYDEAAMQRAAVRLAGALDPSPAALPGMIPIEGGSELLATCRRVGQSLGLSFRTPPELGMGKTAQVSVDRLCEVSRVRARRVILREGWWTRDNGPLLGFLRPDEESGGANAPVALLPWRSGYRLWDPRDDALQEVDESIDERLHGIATMFYPKLPERIVGWRDLLELGLRGSLRDGWMIFATGAAGGLLALLLPIVTAQIVGNAIPEADHSRLLQMVLALGVAAVASSFFQITRSFAVLHVSGRLEGWLQSAVWDRLLALPVSFFRRFTVGDLAARSLGIESIREMITGNVLSSALSAVFSVFSFALLFYYSWRLALVACGLVFLLLVVSLVLSTLQLRRQRAVLEIQGRLESLVFSLIRGISKLRVAGAEPRAFSRWADGFSRQRRETIKARRLGIAQDVFGTVYGLASTLAIFAVVGLSMGAQMPVHELLAFNAAFGQFQAAALGAISTISGLLAVVPSYERLRPILDTPPEVDELKVPAEELRGEVELNQITFRYQADGPAILDGVSLRAEPGEFIALVGPSGAGKSTCLRLLLGFERAEAGSIYFDGQDLATLEIQSVRRQIGVVLQDAKPMTGTILSNILGSAPLGHDRAWEAAAMAGLKDDIEAMPMGMETVVSEGAGTFSGGQKQRLIIARALVRRPRLLFFDEATSSLDNRTQEIVSRSLAKLKATRIIVAHRLSTVRHADRIYVLDRGRVVERGTHDELMAAGGLFYRLARRQMA